MAQYNAAVAPVWQGKIAVEEAMNLPDLAENISGAPSYTGGAGARCKRNLIQGLTRQPAYARDLPFSGAATGRHSRPHT